MDAGALAICVLGAVLAMSCPLALYWLSALASTAVVLALVGVTGVDGVALDPAKAPTGILELGVMPLAVYWVKALDN